MLLLLLFCYAKLLSITLSFRYNFPFVFLNIILDTHRKLYEEIRNHISTLQI